jgi:CRP-like cAMP-binding protein
MDWLDKAKECPVLKGLDSNELKHILSKVNYQVKSYAKDELVASQGDEVKYLMILLAGSVRGEMTDFSGRIIKIEDIHSPRPIASAFVFGKENRFPVDVIANDEVRTLVIFKDELLKLLTISSVIQKNYLDLISTKAQFLSRKIKFLSFKSIKGKIAHYILQLRPGPDGLIRFPATQQSMASLFGVARPSVARAIKDMEDEGIIRTRSKLVEILDHGALVELMNE